MIISDVIFSLPLIIVRTNATLMTNTKSIEKGIYSCHSNISDAINNYSFQVIIGIFNWFVNFYLLDTNSNTLLTNLYALFSPVSGCVQSAFLGIDITMIARLKQISLPSILS